MKPYRILELTLLTMSLMACVTVAGDDATAAAGAFRYDAATGTCQGPVGESGYNAPDPEALFAVHDPSTNRYDGGNAECVDFSSFDFSAHIGLSYPRLDGWSFKGARFDKARLFFVNVSNADFAGADLRGLKYGYTTIEGQGDSFTQGDSCPVGEGQRIRCRR